MFSLLSLSTSSTCVCLDILPKCIIGTGLPHVRGVMIAYATNTSMRVKWDSPRTPPSGFIKYKVGTHSLHLITWLTPSTLLPYSRCPTLV